MSHDRLESPRCDWRVLPRAIQRELKPTKFSWWRKFERPSPPPLLSYRPAREWSETSRRPLVSSESRRSAYWGGLQVRGHLWVVAFRLSFFVMKHSGARNLPITLWSKAWAQKARPEGSEAQVSNLSSSGGLYRFVERSLNDAWRHEECCADAQKLEVEWVMRILWQCELNAKGHWAPLSSIHSLGSYDGVPPRVLPQKRSEWIAHARRRSNVGRFRAWRFRFAWTT